MSSVEDRVNSVEESRELDQRYAAAKAQVEQRQRVEAGQAGALVFAALAYGDALDGNRLFQLMSHWAKLFCIGAAFLIPNLLVVRVLL